MSETIQPLCAVERCKNLDELDERVSRCTAKFEADLKAMHDSIDGVNNEVHGLRSDVQGINENISKMGDSLNTIATTMTRLADFPETWSNLKGFLAVMKWIRGNVFLLALTGSVIWYAMKHSGDFP